MSKHPDDNTAAAKLSRLTVLPFLYFPPFYAWEIPHDIVLWHHNSLLHHFGRKTTVHVQMNHQQSSAYLPASTPINCFNRKYEMSSFCFQTHFHACDTLPQVFWCALIL